MAPTPRRLSWSKRQSRILVDALQPVDGQSLTPAANVEHEILLALVEHSERSVVDTLERTAVTVMTDKHKFGVI